MRQKHRHSQAPIKPITKRDDHIRHQGHQGCDDDCVIDNANHRTSVSTTKGDLKARMEEYLSALACLSLSQDYYGRSLRSAILDGVRWEFGDNAKIEFQAPRSVVLSVGGILAQISP